MSLGDDVCQVPRGEQEGGKIWMKGVAGVYVGGGGDILQGAGEEKATLGGPWGLLGGTLTSS